MGIRIFSYKTVPGDRINWVKYMGHLPKSGAPFCAWCHSSFPNVWQFSVCPSWKEPNDFLAGFVKLHWADLESIKFEFYENIHQQMVL